MVSVINDEGFFTQYAFLQLDEESKFWCIVNRHKDIPGVRTSNGTLFSSHLTWSLGLSIAFAKDKGSIA